jgi:Prolipoprotein diacylglyceryltransferase
MDELLATNAHWGVLPVISVGGIQISTYTLFVLLAIVVAAFIYIREVKKIGKSNDFSLLIAVGAFVGSAIGAKLFEIVINIDLISGRGGLLAFIFSGRTVIGGLIGGTIGVRITKRLIGMKERRGNLFAPAVAMGVAIGRIGCFCNGCCYGKPTSLPWGVNFGDGIYRHPTQFYEAIFMLIMFFWIQYGFKRERTVPGYLFKILMIAYFVFRFMVEFIRTERLAFWGLSYFQLISVFVLVYLILCDNKQVVHQIKRYGKYSEY